MPKKRRLTPTVLWKSPDSSILHVPVLSASLLLNIRQALKGSDLLSQKRLKSLEIALWLTWKKMQKLSLHCGPFCSQPIALFASADVKLRLGIGN